MSTAPQPSSVGSGGSIRTVPSSVATAKPLNAYSRSGAGTLHIWTSGATCLICLVRLPVLPHPPPTRAADRRPHGRHLRVRRGPAPVREGLLRHRDDPHPDRSA